MIASGRCADGRSVGITGHAWDKECLFIESSLCASGPNEARLLPAKKIEKRIDTT
jgi:hypothetical protein